MRIRSVKPEFLKSETVGRLSISARLLFVGLLIMADDEGRGRGTQRLITSEVFGYDDPSTLRVAEWLRELVAQDMVRVYVVDGHTYFHIVNFRKHQRINRPSTSKLPPPPEPGSDIVLPDIPLDVDRPPEPPANHPTLPGWDLSAEADPAPAPVPAPVPEPAPEPAPAPAPPNLAHSIQHRPKSVDEVVAAAKLIGMVEQDARDWWRDCEACQWTRGDGSRITHWRRDMVLARDRLAERRARLAPRTNGTTPSAPAAGGGAPTPPAQATGAQLVNWTRELDVVNARIKSIRDSYDAHVDFGEWSESDRTNIKKLKARAAELKGLLGRQF